MNGASRRTARPASWNRRTVPKERSTAHSNSTGKRVKSLTRRPRRARRRRRKGSVSALSWSRRPRRSRWGEPAAKMGMDGANFVTPFVVVYLFHCFRSWIWFLSLSSDAFFVLLLGSFAGPALNQPEHKFRRWGEVENGEAIIFFQKIRKSGENGAYCQKIVIFQK